jgi:copper chaperone NosL
MTLMDKKFGAEIVTKKGKVYKFDDVNCMIDFHNSGFEPEDNMAYRLVVDFANPEKLIDAQQAFYIKSNQIKSPMASHVASFEIKEQAELNNKEWKGIWLSWGEVVTQFK